MPGDQPEVDGPGGGPVQLAVVGAAQPSRLAAGSRKAQEPFAQPYTWTPAAAKSADST
jgi:hypothetical protein